MKRIHFSMTSLAVVAAITVVLAGWKNASAGIISHNVPDSAYTGYAAQSQFDAIGTIGGSSGTLIGSQWVLTAAHVLTNPNPSNYSFRLRGIGTAYAAVAIYQVPTYTDLTLGDDLALVRLAAPVVGATPAEIYRGNSEIGSLASITGFGISGINDPVTNVTTLASAGQRAGTNTIDAIVNFPGGTSGKAFATDFDFDADPLVPDSSPYNPLGSETATSLEYQLATFDSGGGTFIQENGIWYLAGVNSGVSAAPPILNNRGYGAVSIFTRVSSYQNFIDGTIASVPEPSTGLLLLGSAIGLWALGRGKRKTFA